MSSLEVDGARLAYRLEGEGGRVVAFAHGWCSKLEHWDAQAAHLRRRHRVLRWDRRGMGRSAGPDVAPAASPARHAHDLAAILDAEGIERVVVAGHAGGGPTAVAFAAEHPKRTEGLVLVDTRLHAAAGPGQPDRWADGIERSAERLLGEGGDAYLEQLYRSFFGPRAASGLVDDAVANALATPRPLAAAEMRHIAGDTAGAARRVRCPVLWVSAAPHDTAHVQEVFADVGLMVGHVVGSGHFVQVEVPEQLDAMLDVFLASLP